MRRGGRHGAPSEGGIALAAALGADLLHWWEPSADTITLNGSLVSQLQDRAGSAHLVQGAAGAQPSYVTTGGPNGRPFVRMNGDGSNDNTMDATLAIGAANRSGIYAVVRRSAASDLVPVNSPFQIYHELSTSRFRHQLTFTTGAQTIYLSSPALNASWNLHAARPLASGALSQIGGVTTTPSFTGTSTLPALILFRLGHVSVAGGDFVFGCLINDPTDSKDALIRAYVTQEFLI